MRRMSDRVNDKKGFTLAELLIVVAIIGVLVAIAIPVFTAQLNKAKRSTDMANARSIYAELQADYLANGKQTSTVEANTTAASADGKVTIKDADGTSNTFDFNLSKVEITTGSGSTGPSVKVTDDEGTATTFPGS